MNAAPPPHPSSDITNQLWLFVWWGGLKLSEFKTVLQAVTINPLKRCGFLVIPVLGPFWGKLWVGTPQASLLGYLARLPERQGHLLSGNCPARDLKS